MAEISYKDATVGMDNTSVKAGWVKCGTSYNHITPNEEKAIRSGAQVAKKNWISLAFTYYNWNYGDGNFRYS